MTTLNSMTVGELIAALEEYPDDAPVLFSYNYGDHCRTMVADRIRHVEDLRVAWSDYHSTYKLIDEEEYTDHGWTVPEDTAEAIIIS